MNCKAEADRIAEQIRWFTKRQIIMGSATADECRLMLDYLTWLRVSLPLASVRSGADLFRLYKIKNNASMN